MNASSRLQKEISPTGRNLDEFIRRFIRLVERETENKPEGLEDVLSALARSLRDPARTAQHGPPADPVAVGQVAAQRVALDAARVLGAASQLEELADALLFAQSHDASISRALDSARALRQIVIDTAARPQQGE